MFDSPVAFTAGLSTSFSGGGDYAVIPYNHIYLNHGEGYRLDLSRHVAQAKIMHYARNMILAWRPMYLSTLVLFLFFLAPLTITLRHL